MLHSKRFDAHFLTASADSISAYRNAIDLAQAVLIRDYAGQSQPYSGKSPLELAAVWADSEVCPAQGYPLGEVLQRVGEAVLGDSVAVSHPACIAHLHCPPVIPALAAEVLISATNQSMDSWDQSPAATILEQRIVGWLCEAFGYAALTADGVFTSGGTQSNFMGLLLARDHYCQTALNWSVQKQGLPPEAARFRILCSTVSHFTIRQAAALLGLGEQSVVPIPTDAEFRLCPEALEHTWHNLRHQALIPIALVATVGTTDFGSIDPLPEIAEFVERYGLWLHVDAAYGGALILSDRHRSKLIGIEAADSIAVDFHKLFYQPISCGAFLLKNQTHFNLIRLHADYLNPQTNEQAGIPDLVTKSLQTTRRFDALKLWISLQSLGQRAFADLIDTTIALAAETARLIITDRELELACLPVINAVVFRYYAASVPVANQINRQIRVSLLQQGQAVLAQTQIGDRIYLKLTLLNPRTTLNHLIEIFDAVKRLGRDLEQQFA